jgi:hypothetical protein
MSSLRTKYPAVSLWRSESPLPSGRNRLLGETEPGEKLFGWGSRATAVSIKFAANAAVKEQQDGGALEMHSHRRSLLGIHRHSQDAAASIE